MSTPLAPAVFVQPPRGRFCDGSDGLSICRFFPFDLALVCCGERNSESDSLYTELLDPLRPRHWYIMEGTGKVVVENSQANVGSRLCLKGVGEPS